VTGGTSLPGPHGPGLIEASPSSPHGRRCRQRLPGPHGPGLIEAMTWTRCETGLPPRVSPGHTARASLKHRRLPLTDQRERRCLPGPHGPGLIEAGRRKSRPRRRKRLPGPHGPGLIEASRRSRRWSCRAPSLPGPHGPGLIEACPAGPRDAPCPSLPGPHGPGLIEALPPGPCRRRYSRHSPRAPRPGPH